MKKTRGFLLAVAFAAMAFTVSCIGDDSSALLGKWIGDEEYIELFKDGTGVFKGEDEDGDEISGSISWKLVENKRLVMTLDVMGLVSVTEAYDYEISDNKLTLTDDKGEKEIYVRPQKSEEFKAKQKEKAIKEKAEVQSTVADTEQKSSEQRSSYSDQRDGKKYKTVKIGNQTWFAENLNYEASGSKCYDNAPSNCQKYGRLYDWNTALKACPSGWHLPSKEEWEVLDKAVGGKDVAGKKLKSKSSWKDNGNGTDDYGFSTLPGGYSDYGSFYGVGLGGFWWSASGYDIIYAHYRSISYHRAGAYWDEDDIGKSSLLSVRCLQN